MAKKRSKKRAKKSHRKAHRKASKKTSKKRATRKGKKRHVVRSFLVRFLVRFLRAPAASLASAESDARITPHHVSKSKFMQAAGRSSKKTSKKPRTIKL